jgi:hypothetical protein
MTQGNQSDSGAKKQLRAGRIMSALPALFLLVDGGMKLVKPVPVVEATVRLGYPESVIFGLGIVLLACTVVYFVTPYVNPGCDLADWLLGRCSRYSGASR